jgi:hypothetical protein
MNYAELEQALKDWLNKPNLGKIAPTIIRFAQRDLEDNLRIRPMEYVPPTVSVSAATASLALPSDYIELIYLVLLEGAIKHPIEYRVDPKTMNSFAFNTDDTGLPVMIARVGDNLIFDVKTNIDYTRDWAYYRRLTTLTATHPANTNWWSQNAEEAFLMSCLNKASLYVPGIPKEDKDKWGKAALDTRELLRLGNSSESTSGVVLRSVPWTL